MPQIFQEKGTPFLDRLYGISEFCFDRLVLGCVILLSLKIKLLCLKPIIAEVWFRV